MVAKLAQAAAGAAAEPTEPAPSLDQSIFGPAALAAGAAAAGAAGADWTASAALEAQDVGSVRQSAPAHDTVLLAGSTLH